MNNQHAIEVLQQLIVKKSGRWLDVGAGTGLFTLALDSVLEAESEIYALDKNPHVLYSLKLNNSKLFIEDQNFERELDLPLFDGIVIANTLHTTAKQEELLKKLLTYLKPQGELIVVELDTNVPLLPWVPNPIKLNILKELLARLNRKVDQEILNIPMLASQDMAYAVSVLSF